MALQKSIGTANIFFRNCIYYLVKMVRKFKHHEEKLLRKTDFMNWEVSNTQRENEIMR